MGANNTEGDDTRHRASHGIPAEFELDPAAYDEAHPHQFDSGGQATARRGAPVAPEGDDELDSGIPDALPSD